MKTRRTKTCTQVAVGGLIAFAALQADTAPVAAQDCGGEDCLPCDWSSYQGSGAPGRWYDETCEEMSSGHCDWCFEPAPLVSADAPTEKEVFEAVLTADVEDLEPIVQRYGDYLLLHPKRGVIVFRGTPCDVDGLGSTVLLTPDKARALARLRTPLLEDFLAAKAATQQ